jgi:uncharacterized membrane protein
MYVKIIGQNVLNNCHETAQGKKIDLFCAWSVASPVPRYAQNNLTILQKPETIVEIIYIYLKLWKIIFLCLIIMGDKLKPEVELTHTHVYFSSLSHSFQ